MKTRQGFVSNSSSSSFLIRGVKIPTKDLIRLFKIDLSTDTYNAKEPGTDQDSYIVYDAPELKTLRKDLELQTIRCFFDGEEFGEIIIGQNIGTGEDGEVKELEEANDKEILDKLKKFGLKTNKLKFFLQYVSNDNY
jgi:hypothetical protein